MVRKIFCLSLALMLVALAVPAMASTSVWVETPAADGAVNLRSGPGTEYPVIGWAVYGDELVLLSAGNQWYQVQIVKNGKIGFMSKEYISFDKPSSTPSTGTTAWISTKTANGSVNIRSGPGTKHKSLGKLSLGTILSLEKTEGDWASFSFALEKSSIGYVHSNYIVLAMDEELTRLDVPSTDPGTLGEAQATGRVNVCSGPGKGYAKLGQLRRGQRVAVWAIDGNWAQITWTGSQRGYVYLDYLHLMLYLK